MFRVLLLYTLTSTICQAGDSRVRRFPSQATMTPAQMLTSDYQSLDWRQICCFKLSMCVWCFYGPLGNSVDSWLMTAPFTELSPKSAAGINVLHIPAPFILLMILRSSIVTSTSQVVSEK